MLIAGHNHDHKGIVFHVNNRGDVTDSVEIQDASFFLNGMVHFKDDTFLIADSARGAIWNYNATTKRSFLWLDHKLLKSPLPADASFRVGVNGLKFKGDVLYVTNSQLEKIIKIPLCDGGRPGVPEVFVGNILGDDFEIDSNGDLYITTHSYNSVVKISSVGKKTIVAQETEGMTGCTAAAFGNKSKERSLFVVTNGGMSFAPESEVREGRIMELYIDRPIHCGTKKI